MHGFQAVEEFAAKDRVEHQDFPLFGGTGGFPVICEPPKSFADFYQFLIDVCFSDSLGVEFVSKIHGIRFFTDFLSVCEDFSFLRVHIQINALIDI